MTSLPDALALLQREARPAELAGMARFGMQGAGRLGLSMPAVRRIARTLGQDHSLALALWDSGIPDAQIVAALVADPALLTARQMDRWVTDFQSWDVCDQVCGSAFLGSTHAWRKVHIWSRRKPEFVRRAAFTLLATLAVHDRQSDDARFIAAMALIEDAADDQRNFVRKAVNWALRGIGKRNIALNAAAIAVAERLAQRDSRAARWIASDALRELGSAAVQMRLRRKVAGKG